MGPGGEWSQPCKKCDKLFIVNRTMKGTIWEALLQRKPVCLPGMSWGTLALPNPGTPYATCLRALLPQCRAEQRHLPVALLADALQGPHVLLESANLTEEEAAMQAPGSGGETLPRAHKSCWILSQGCWFAKKLVRPVWLGPGSLPWLRAATAGSSSSLPCCAKCARGRRLVLKPLLLRLVSKLGPTSCQSMPRSSKRAC